MKPDHIAVALFSYSLALCNQVDKQTGTDPEDEEIRVLVRLVLKECNIALHKYPAIKVTHKIKKKIEKSFYALEEVAVARKNVNIEPILSFMVLAFEEVWDVTKNPAKNYYLKRVHGQYLALLAHFDPELTKTEDYILALLIHSDWKEIIKKY